MEVEPAGVRAPVRSGLGGNTLGIVLSDLRALSVGPSVFLVVRKLNSVSPFKKRPIDQYLNNSFPVASSHLRQRLIKEGILQAKCYRCGITEWLGQPAPLELEHIDGNHKNNLLENLTILCPNCHAQTPTYCGKNMAKRKPKRHCVDCGKAVTRMSLRCLSCAAIRRQAELHDLPHATKIVWPDYEDLMAMVDREGYSATGRTLGVSDNAVRKRLRRQEALL